MSKPKGAPKPKVTKGVTDASWTGSTVASAMTVEGLRALDRTLPVEEAYKLSVDLRSALHARNEPLSQGKVRFFYKKSGDEIESGDLVNFFANPSPGMSTSTFLYELGSWWDLAGEMIVGSILDAGSGMPNGIYPLSPFRLSVQEPMPARHLAQVRKWRYSWLDGIQVVYGADAVCLMKNFNPMSEVRGLPPAYAAANEASSGLEAIAYNRRFFSNNAEPSHIVVLPQSIDPKDAEAFKSEYFANHSLHAGNAHRVLFVAGTEVEIKPIGDGMVKDAAFANLLGLTAERIMRLYKVPPVHGGLWDKAKFDSVSEQNRVFAETVLMPQAERLSQFLQMIVDRFFPNATGRRAGKGHKVSRSVRAAVDKAAAERPDSDIVVILDLDHLPIVSELKMQKVAFAKEMQNTFKISPLEAADYVGVEIESNEANQKVWVSTTEQPADVASVLPAAPGDPAAPDDSEQPSEPETQQEPSADEQKAVKEATRNFRALVLERLEQGKLFKLAEADALSTHKGLRVQFRRDLLALKGIMDSGGDVKAGVKQYLNNAHSRKAIKRL